MTGGGSPRRTSERIMAVAAAMTVILGSIGTAIAWIALTPEDKRCQLNFVGKLICPPDQASTQPSQTPVSPTPQVGVPTPETPTSPTDSPTPLDLSRIREKLIGTWYFEGIESRRPKNLCLRLKQDNYFDSVFSNPDPDFERGSWRIDYKDNFPNLELYTSPKLYATYQILSIEDNDRLLESRLINSSDPVSDREKPLRNFHRKQCMRG